LYGLVFTPCNFHFKYKSMNASLARNINAVAILGICGILLGAYYMQFGKGEFPCPLCLLQRLAMLGVALGAMMNLRFGIHPTHYGISILSAVLGACISARQILLHINTPGSGYGSAVYGIHLYSWALIVFIVAIILIGLMLFSDSQYEDYDDFKSTKEVGWIAALVFFVVVLITVANVATTYLECGFQQCPDNPTSYIILDK